MYLTHSIKRIFTAGHILIIILMILLPAAAPAIDYEENFSQKIDAAFFASLTEREDEPRAIFAECAAGKNDVVIYARYTKPNFILNAKLPAALEKFIKPAIFTAESFEFKTFKKNGELFYSHGKAFYYKSDAKSKAAYEIIYVPYKINGRENDAFICDRGFLKITVNARKNLTENSLNELFGNVFSERAVKIKKTVKYNQYYYERYDYFGYVNRRALSARSFETNEALFYPTHKITFNRNISGRREKHLADLRLAILFLKGNYPLISQDTRAKTSGVKGDISLDPAKLDQTDIGSGQNTYIYLSYGPGINYYDCPYLKDSGNFPSPRFIFDKNEVLREEAQFYPKNSWETSGRGIFRFYEINFFQAYLSSKIKKEDGWTENYPAYEEPIFMALDKRFAYLHELNGKLINYGLLNDTKELILNFDFLSQKHLGNIINNELRTAYAVYPAFSSSALIIAPGTKNEYIKAYEESIKKDGQPEYICGTHYLDYFLEAHECSDFGMRAAYLKYLISRTDPYLNRLANSFVTNKNIAGGEKIRPGYGLFMKACAKLIQKEKDVFFNSKTAKLSAGIQNEAKEAFYDYLYAVRANKPQNIQKKSFLRFESLYKKNSILMNSHIVFDKIKK